jgi:hypothetical protein
MTIRQKRKSNNNHHQNNNNKLIYHLYYSLALSHLDEGLVLFTLSCL